MDSNTTEQIKEILRLQAETLSSQKRSFEELLLLQRQLIAKQERDARTRKKLLVVLGVLFVAWLFLTLAPIWLW